jgi:LysM repeat protein
MDDDSTPKAGPSTMVPVAIGLVGVLLGAAALFFALSNRGATQAVNDLADDLAAVKSQVKDLDKQATDLDGKFSALSDTNSNLGTQIQNVTGQVNDALNKMGAAITEDREQIKTQGDAIQQLSSKSSPSTASSGSGKSSSSGAAVTTATPGAGGVHIIVANDTFGSLAKKYGVSVSAIEAANPDANPTRLHLGQKIIIPPAPAPSAGGAAPSASGASTTPSADTPAPAPPST